MDAKEMEVVDGGDIELNPNYTRYHGSMAEAVVNFVSGFIDGVRDAANEISSNAHA